MIIKVKVILRSWSFQGQGHFEVFPESNFKCLNFCPEAGGWLSSECFRGELCVHYLFLSSKKTRNITHNAIISISRNKPNIVSYLLIEEFFTGCICFDALLIIRSRLFVFILPNPIQPNTDYWNIVKLNCSSCSENIFLKNVPKTQKCWASSNSQIIKNSFKLEHPFLFQRAQEAALFLVIWQEQRKMLLWDCLTFADIAFSKSKINDMCCNNAVCNDGQFLQISDPSLPGNYGCQLGQCFVRTAWSSCRFRSRLETVQIVNRISFSNSLGFLDNRGRFLIWLYLPSNITKFRRTNMQINYCYLNFSFVHLFKFNNENSNIQYLVYIFVQLYSQRSASLRVCNWSFQNLECTLLM